MKSEKSGARLRAVFAAAAVGGVATFVWSVPVRANEVEDAKKVINTMTDEHIRAELQRRSVVRQSARPAPTIELSEPAAAQTPSGAEAPVLSGAPTDSGASVPDSTPSALAGGSEGKPTEGGGTRSFRSLRQPVETIDDATFATAIRTRAIYGGKDDRAEWYQVKNEEIRRLARASVAIFRSEKTQMTPTEVKLKTSTLGEDWGLCPGELFSAQATGPQCSGTLVREDVVLTAAHCVAENADNPKIPTVDRLSFVFGYRVERPGDLGPSYLPADHIYNGKALIERNKEQDWALVKLNQPVPASVAEPVKAWRNTPVAKGERVYVIGYPSGLPLKYAPNASVQDTSHPVYFIADLDTFGGNSGSGVFTQETNELVGILVRGEPDYLKDKKGCRKVNACPTTCKGEEITRITLVRTP